MKYRLVEFWCRGLLVFVWLGVSLAVSELQLVDGAGCVQSNVSHHLPEAEYSESSLI